MRNLAIFAAAIILPAGAAAAADSQIAVETILTKHRAAVGSEQARAAVRNRVAEGTAHYEVVTGGAGVMNGKATVVSTGTNSRYIMKFNNADYPGEDLLTDGSKVQVYGMPRRSVLGELLYVHDALLREGVFSGVLSTAWPLLDPQLRGAQLRYGGRKKMDGAELEELRFLPKKRSDVDIKLYFEPESGRHVRTVATLTIEPRLIGDLVQNAEQKPVRYRIEQRFTAFQEFDGIMLPTICSTQLTADGYLTIHYRYENTFTNIQHNLELDARNFQLK